MAKTNWRYNAYQFLWGPDPHKPDRNFARYVRAKNITEACKKFHGKLPKTLSWLDYEVRHKDDFIDISDNKLLKEHI